MKKVVIISLLALLFGFTARASHNNGGEFSYEWVSGSTYKIKLVLYVDCSSNLPDTIYFNTSSTSCSVSRFDTLALSYREDASQVCDTNLLACNGGTLNGQTKYVYEANVSNFTPCPDWRLSYSVCCRNAAAVNIVSPNTHNFYVETTFNNTVYLNNKSPYFADNPRWLVPVNGANLINSGAYDADGDSLYYSLVAARESNTAAMPYQAGYSAAQPFGGGSTTIDPQTGIISSFTPTVGQFILAVRVDEFRDGQLLSSMYRDFITNVYVGSNQLPSITNLNLSPYELCTVDTLNIDIYSQDPTDSITTRILYPFAPGVSGLPYFSNATVAPFNEHSYLLNDTNNLKWELLGLQPDKDYVIYINVEEEVCQIRNIQSYAVIVSTSYCVWPGDANSDLIADIYDVLPIGVYFGNTGTTRPGATLNWEGQWAQNWGPKQLSGDDIKHVDCNGDGTIDANDTTAILLNYNLTHQKSGGIHQAGANDPDLYVNITPDTIGTSAPLSIPIMLGTPSVPADSVYGVVLRLSYDPSRIDSVAGITVDYSNSWLGTEGVDMITLDTNFYDNGQIDIGLVRTDGQMVSNGFGELLTLNVITIDNLSGKATTYGSLIVDFIEAKIIDVFENDRDFNQQLDSVVIKDITSGVAPTEQHHVLMAPNPTSGKFMIQADHAIDRVEVYNAVGQTIPAHQIQNGNTRIIDLNGREQGLYLVKVIYEDQSFTVRKLFLK
ncbi:MAG: T9SS type A sorting domain-containing protein [Flavobacteriales bacterium]|nr:T9SS type A sorting domain-containing protein [Flavobacteriales bacterium]